MKKVYNLGARLPFRESESITMTNTEGNHFCSGSLSITEKNVSKWQVSMFDNFWFRFFTVLQVMAIFHR